MINKLTNLQQIGNMENRLKNIEKNKKIVELIALHALHACVNGIKYARNSRIICYPPSRYNQDRLFSSCIILLFNFFYFYYFVFPVNKEFVTNFFFKYNLKLI
jgi:hypothetical protein